MTIYALILYTQTLFYMSSEYLTVRLICFTIMPTHSVDAMSAMSMSISFLFLDMEKGSQVDEALL